PLVSYPPDIGFENVDNDDLPRPVKVWDSGGPSLRELLAAQSSASHFSLTTPLPPRPTLFPYTTPFKWNGGKQTAVIGLNSVKLNKDTVLASYTLVADSVYCDYDPIKKKANIGSNFLERESF